MDDIDKVRATKGLYTVADFSNYKNINTGDYKHMKFSSKETIIEPTEESVETIKEENIETKESIKRERPGTQIMVNPEELKDIAIKVLPKLNEISSGISYEKVCNDAIEYAFTFEQVWNKKINIGE